jgi:phosphoribosylanthranilate isomerase
MSRVKICGITSPQDALSAMQAGADAIGLQFVKHSPRRVTLDKALEIKKVLPPFISVVGVFFNETKKEIISTIEYVGLDYVQLHGSEGIDLLRGLPARTIKTIGVESKQDLKDLDRYPADALLLDTKIDGRCGGTGQSFDWSLLDGVITSIPLILAGGLNAENIVKAMKITKLQLLDLCTGVEVEPGIKSFKKMQEFIRIVQNTNPHL